MFAILLETGSETGLFRACRYDSRRRFRRAPARFSIPMNLGMNLGLHGFAHLGSTSNHKEWRFFGGQKGLSSMIPI
jgi:hypothetical protein